jgi:hypothetical protein
MQINNLLLILNTWGLFTGEMPPGKALPWTSINISAGGGASISEWKWQLSIRC